jgi:iron complex transport system substrate-binding protein
VKILPLLITLLWGAVSPLAAQDCYPVKVKVTRAVNFSVTYHGFYKHVTVNNPWPGADRSFEYILLERGYPRPKGFARARVIEIPVRSMAALSSTYLTGIALLGREGTITAVDNRRTVSSPGLKKGITEKRIAEVGSGPSVSVERLLLLYPDCVMTMAIGEGDSYRRLSEAGLPVVVNADWTEQDPLGRCEWIKFLALFYNREREAEEFFNRTVEEYEKVRRQAATGKPVRVLTGIPWGGLWGVPGGRSYMARLIADAGGDYYWKGTGSPGSLQLDPETVYAVAGGADIWLVNGAGVGRLSDLERIDSRHTLFAPYRNGRVWNNDLRADPVTGANDWWESGPWFPQRILADLVSIFNPSVLPGHRRVYYRKVDP